MGSLGARPRDLRVPEEVEVRRRVTRTTTAVFVGFLVIGWLGMTQAAALLGGGPAVGIMGTLLLTSYGAVLGVLLFRASQRELALIKTLSIFLSEAPMAIVFLDEAGKVVYGNRALERLTGRSLASAAGTSAGAFVHPDDRPRLAREMERRARGESTVYELRLLDAQGTVLQTIVLGLPFIDGGRYDGSLAAIIDVSELYAARESAQRYKELSSFALDAVTHDLSNRMQDVLARAGIAGSVAGGDAERARAALSAVTASAERAARLIREVKQIAAAERQEWPRRKMRLGDLVSLALENADLPTANRVDTQIAPEAAAVEIEASDLAPVVVAKLIEQAAEGARKGSAQPVLLTATIERGSTPEAVVRVHGFARDVSDDDLRLMLAPPREHGAREEPWRLGVRLAFASAVAQANGWGVRATRGEQGKGAVFEVRMPAVSAQPAR